jgi:xanthine dehydrogenase accessory factor
MIAETATTLYDELRTALDSETPVAMVTVVSGEPLGAKLLVLPDRTSGTLGQRTLDDTATADARALLLDGKSETRPYNVPETGETVELFFEVFPPPPVLLIFGAVHVAQAVTKVAKLLGFKVIVSDARAKLATRERFPEADEIIQAWPDDTLENLDIQPNTYVAILTHDPKFDEPALVGTIETKARYIGAVGSRKTNRDRRQRLIDAGLDAASLSRIRGPIGLDIGADTPEEMAISILSEIIAVRHGRHGGPLTEATGNIRGDQESTS